MDMLGLKIPFKKQQFEAREEAILDAVNKLLSEKGFDLMTMDDVADAVASPRAASTSTSRPRKSWLRQ